MRALAVVALALAWAGCGAATTDPCKGIAGTCVSLTVQSSTVATVDSLHIVASGAVTGEQTSSGGRANLPIVVALELPASAAGSLDLHVDGVLAGMIVGSCDTSAVVTPGQHTTAVCTLVGVNNGGVDMSMGGDDLTSVGPDMVTVQCDPKGMTGPKCQWRWQTPLPQGDDLHAVVAFGDIDTFAISIDGLVLHRDATAWSPLAAQPPFRGFQTATLFAAGGTSMDLFATGADATFAPVLAHSPDRGLTWTKETLPSTTGFVYGGATTGGYAVLTHADSVVYSRDGGTGVWTSQTVPGTGGYLAAAMDFSNEVVVGSVSGSTAAIAYNNVGGATWTAVATANITPSTEALTGVCLGPGATKSWWAVGGAVILHASGNTPTTWAQQSSGVTAGAQLQGCVASDSTHAWAYGTNGAIYVTSDGTNWSGVTTPPGTTETFTSGAHSSAAALTVVGTNGVIFRSTNGGSSFTAERTGPQDVMNSIFGPAPATLFAVGEGGAIYTTSNDGATWTKLVAPTATGTTAILNAVWAASPTDVYAVGAAGTIVHSANGTTFTKYAGANAPAATALLTDVWGSTALGVFAVGATAPGLGQTRTVLRSTDHGTTWAPITITGFTGVAATATSVFALGSDVWVCGDGGLIYHSSDGTTFTQQTTNTTAGITKLRGITGHIIALLGTDPGTYLTSSNAGVTWNAPTAAAFNDSAGNLAFVPDESAIYVFGSYSPQVVSYDKGGTWVPNVTVMNDNAMATGGAFAFAGNDVFIVGRTGIIHYGN